MSQDRIPGELAALVQIIDTDGASRLAAVIDTGTTSETGVLVAPPRGFAGAMTFQPVPRLRELLVSQHPDVFSIEAVDSTPAGPDPDDPRGLRSGGRRRAPGIL